MEKESLNNDRIKETIETIVKKFAELTPRNEDEMELKEGVLDFLNRFNDTNKLL